MNIPKILLRQKSGFTLVEWLVAIGITAILSTLLFSAIQSARSATHNVRCVANLKRLGGAVFAWSMDHDNRILPVLYKPSGYSFPWSRVLLGITSERGENYLAPDTYPPMDQTKATGKSVFDCPANTNRAFYDHLNYGYSSFPGFSTTDNSGTGVPLTARFSNIQRPSQTILIGELNASASYSMAVNRVDWLAFPHHEKMNGFFADGSIQRVEPPIVNGTPYVPPATPQWPWY